jgi:hypothetical protein
VGESQVKVPQSSSRLFDAEEKREAPHLTILTFFYILRFTGARLVSCNKVLKLTYWGLPCITHYLHFIQFIS